MLIPAHGQSCDLYKQKMENFELSVGCEVRCLIKIDVVRFLAHLEQLIRRDMDN